MVRPAGRADGTPRTPNGTDRYLISIRASTNEAMVDAQSAAEGVMGSESTVAALARSALSSDVVSTAAIARHWRETYVAAPVGGALSEATGRDKTRRDETRRDETRRDAS